VISFSVRSEGLHKTLQNNHPALSNLQSTWLSAQGHETSVKPLIRLVKDADLEVVGLRDVLLQLKMIEPLVQAGCSSEIVRKQLTRWIVALQHLRAQIKNFDPRDGAVEVGLHPQQGRFDGDKSRFVRTVLD
jgi:hypothetical protein